MSATSVTIEELLQTTSRTFALSIPLLPEPLDQQLTLAYLVFRIADTLEDAETLDRDQRVDALNSFSDLLVVTEDNSKRASHIQAWSDRWSQASYNDDYNRLVSETSRVLALVEELDGDASSTIYQNAKRSVRGMVETLSKADGDGNLTLSNIRELREYCYFVAGIVGEMITELFLASHSASAEAKNELNETAASFGEALQLVNILKDAGDDANCGRAYIPSIIPRREVFELARTNLIQAERYVKCLRGMNAPPGMIAFCDAPLQLAGATLAVVEEFGAGSKVPRDKTFALLQQVMQRAGLVESPDN